MPQFSACLHIVIFLLDSEEFECCLDFSFFISSKATNLLLNQPDPLEACLQALLVRSTVLLRRHSSAQLSGFSAEDPGHSKGLPTLVRM